MATRGDFKPLMSLHDELKCAVCLGEYKNPKTLPCNHSFCLDCIENIRKHEHAYKRVRCPTCRATNYLPDNSARNLPTAFLIKRLQGIMKQRNEYTCPEHFQELKFYCSTCEMVVCYSCTLDMHRDHNCETIEWCYDEQVQDIFTDWVVLKEKNSELRKAMKELWCTEEDLRAIIEETTSEIAETAEYEIARIQAEADYWLEILEEDGNKKLKTLNQLIKRGNAMWKHLKVLEKDIEQTLLHGERLRILKKKRQLMRLMNQYTAGAEECILQIRKELGSSDFGSRISKIQRSAVKAVTTSDQPKQYCNQENNRKETTDEAVGLVVIIIILILIIIILGLSVIWLLCS